MRTNLRTIEDLQQLIELKTPEDLHLDYKRSASLSNDSEISKDVSAFANSDGGVLVYGVSEKKVDGRPIPEELDGGVSDASLSREQVEDKITGRINPRISGIRIHPIPSRTAGQSYYVIEIPKSYRAPHQDSYSKKYYKRFNFKSEPMEHYEIQDLRHRIERMPPLVNIDVEVRNGAWVDLVVGNDTDVPARDLVFQLNPDLPELSKNMAPNFVTRGIRHLSPGKTYRITVGSAIESLSENPDHPSRFDVSVEYFDIRQGARVNEVFEIDLLDYSNTPIVHSDVERMSETLEKVLVNLTAEMKRLKAAIEGFAPIVGGTGLQISSRTLRDLKSISVGSEPREKIDAAQCDARAFREELGVTREMAMLLCRFFRYRHRTKQTFEEVPGMTPDLKKRLKEKFLCED